MSNNLKRTIIAAICAAILVINAKAQQNMCEHVLYHFNKETGKGYVAGRCSVGCMGDMVVVITKTDREVCMIININDCITGSNGAIIRFTDGTKIALANQSPVVVNCADPYHLSIFDRDAIEVFTKKNIEAIRVSTQDGYVQKQLDEKESNVLKSIMVCLTKEQP